MHTGVGTSITTRVGLVIGTGVGLRVGTRVGLAIGNGVGAAVGTLGTGFGDDQATVGNEDGNCVRQSAPFVLVESVRSILK